MDPNFFQLPAVLNSLLELQSFLHAYQPFNITNSSTNNAAEIIQSQSNHVLNKRRRLLQQRINQNHDYRDHMYSNLYSHNNLAFNYQPPSEPVLQRPPVAKERQNVPNAWTYGGLQFESEASREAYVKTVEENKKVIRQLPQDLSFMDRPYEASFPRYELFPDFRFAAYSNQPETSKASIKQLSSIEYSEIRRDFDMNGTEVFDTPDADELLKNRDTPIPPLKHSEVVWTMDEFEMSTSEPVTSCWSNVELVPMQTAKSSNTSEKIYSSSMKVQKHQNKKTVEDVRNIASVHQALKV